MLIVLGGLAALPTEPYESARLDGATEWQLFRYITLPLVAPFIVVAAVIRTIDALKTFDTIYVITGGGPGTASETINLYLYLQAFAFYNIGTASAVVVVFFVIVLALALLLLHVREKTKWTVAKVAAPVRAKRHAHACRSSAWLRKVGFWLSVFVIVSPADARLPVDAFAVAQDRDRQHHVSADLHSQSADVRQFPAGLRAELDRPLPLEQHRRVGRRDAGRAGDRHPGRIRHRPRRREAAHRADPARPDDARALLPDPAVRGVPVPAPQQHAHGAGDHAPRHHGADRRLHHGRLLRDAAQGARGGGADRRRQRVVDVPLRRAAARAARHHRRHDPRRSSSRGTTSCSARCSPGARRERCRSRSTTC